MFEGLGRRYREYRRRLRRLERREVRELRQWLETTTNLTQASVLLFVPLLIALVTMLSNVVAQVSFLLFPPLASGTYTLFADPEGRYSSPRKFVGGMTLGAFAGWVALEASARFLYNVPPASVEVYAGAAALSVALTGGLTWTLDLELPTAFSTALLALFIGTSQFAYVVGVFLSSSLVASVFVVWRNEFYEQRARYLYQTTQSDDRVLVPMRGERTRQTAMFGARLAAAHEAAKVVLLDVVSDESIQEAERDLLAKQSDSTADRENVDAPDAREVAEGQMAVDTASQLEQQAKEIRTKIGVPTEVVVAVEDGDAAETVLATARETNCDLVVAPYEQRYGGTTGFISTLFRSDMDVVAFRSATERITWKRMLVSIRRPGNVAHAMIDYAERLAGRTGSVSICSCIDEESERRPTEGMLANLAETTSVRCETRVSHSDVEAFIRRNESQYDLVVLGASTDRSTASRMVSRPTYERIDDVTTDIAIVHVG